MNHIVFAYPGDLNTPTGGYGYDRRIISGLKEQGWTVDLLELGEGFPFPSKAVLAEVDQRLAALADDSLLVIDGLAYGVMADVVKAHSRRIKIIALVHHPLCQENGLGPGEVKSLRESEDSALKFARHVIVTSPATAEQVRDLFKVASENLTVVLPGTDKPEPTEFSTSDKANLLSVGTILPRKGYDLLFKALGRLKAFDWRLDIVGGTGADPECFENVKSLADDLQITDRLTFHGGVTETALSEFYRNADIFVLASRYEGYGMAYTEALAYGLPVIGSGGGAVRDTLPEGASIYCGVEDEDALFDALDHLISSKENRHKIALAAREAAKSLPDWSDAARDFGNTLQGVTG